MKIKNKSDLWLFFTLFLTVSILFIIAYIVIYIDPFFHYHKPNPKLEYYFNEERYINDGIAKNFEYDSIITGTSMAQNFKASEFNEIFNKNSIKVPFEGGYYPEVNRVLKRAFKSKNNISIVIRSLDESYLIQDKDAEPSNIFKNVESKTTPKYLINDSILDDVNYFLNKTVLFKYAIFNVVDYTKNGNKSISFDEYSNWSDSFEYGLNAINEVYTVSNKNIDKKIFDENTKTIILDNLEKNVIEVIKENPNTTFYLYFPPYSILHWYNLKNQNTLDYKIDAQEFTIIQLLELKNVKLFSFYTNYDLIKDFNNYRDPGHYGGWINSKILNWMYNEEYMITKDNYKDYINQIRDFYNNFNYEEYYGGIK